MLVIYATNSYHASNVHWINTFFFFFLHCDFSACVHFGIFSSFHFFWDSKWMKNHLMNHHVHRVHFQHESIKIIVKWRPWTIFVNDQNRHIENTKWFVWYYILLKSLSEIQCEIFQYFKISMDDFLCNSMHSSAV